jgi:competence protein ComFC
MNVWLKSIADLVFPQEPVPDNLPLLQRPFCEQCCEPFEGQLNDTFLCPNCVGRKWTLRSARAVMKAEGHVREVIHEFKYNGKFHHLPLLTSWIEQGYRDYFQNENIHALIPVPLFPKKKRERGFNQAFEIARMLSKRTKIPVWDILVRKKDTGTQTRLKRSARIRNLLQAFELKSKFDVHGGRLLIIDDVFTTGATVDSCAYVLHQATACDIFALTVARG